MYFYVLFLIIFHIFCLLSKGRNRPESRDKSIIDQDQNKKKSPVYASLYFKDNESINT